MWSPKSWFQAPFLQNTDAGVPLLSAGQRIATRSVDSQASAFCLPRSPPSLSLVLCTGRQQPPVSSIMLGQDELRPERNGARNASFLISAYTLRTLKEGLVDTSSDILGLLARRPGRCPCSFDLIVSVLFKGNSDMKPSWCLLSQCRGWELTFFLPLNVLGVFCQISRRVHAIPHQCDSQHSVKSCALGTSF